ncbi:MAG: protoheme IX farnesyltransferase [Verrucomicrobia bacterium RIFCSPHIGHO2_12_FULL_41_10]|nr:MAG: protoheme IX farnesyltransferase [Verrucomicrobia bacterium RIFCSPHIGHO2_12_FULL_41_10]HLB33524.1 heme o synthase [Chthoniobacterales bacterium]
MNFSKLALGPCINDFMELVKVRLSLLVLITTLVGFLLGWSGPMDYFLLSMTLVGTALSACGASALNQWWERYLDGLMKRTQDRPLPAKRLHPTDALLFGILCCLVGTVLLLVFVNLLSAVLSFATIVIYVLAYTPMKRRSTFNTLLGAIPGAIPPLIGWTAATGEIGLSGYVLFLILWFWQMPHFLAIAWLYREDYAAAGFQMLSVEDPEGLVTSRQALLYALGLLAVSLLPALIGMASPLYFVAAFLLGLLFVLAALFFVMHRTIKNARRLFFASIIYLPLLLGVLLFFSRRGAS